MTKPNTTRIAAILDRSSSMMVVAATTVNALNDFIAEQRKVTTDVATFSLTQFNHQHETVGPVPLDQVPLIKMSEGARVLFGLTASTTPGKKVETNGWSYFPSGNTALYATVLHVIDTLGAELAAMAEDDRPSDVIVLIQTDGQDNASLPGTQELVAEKIKHQQDVYNWKFLFIGANIDVDHAARGLNIPVQNSVAYLHTNAGTEAVMKSMSANVSSYRSTKNSADLSFRGGVDPFDPPTASRDRNMDADVKGLVGTPLPADLVSKIKAVNAEASKDLVSKEGSQQ